MPDKENPKAMRRRAGTRPADGFAMDSYRKRLRSGPSKEFLEEVGETPAKRRLMDNTPTRKIERKKKKQSADEGAAAYAKAARKKVDKNSPIAKAAAAAKRRKKKRSKDWRGSGDYL